MTIRWATSDANGGREEGELIMLAIRRVFALSSRALAIPSIILLHISMAMMMNCNLQAFEKREPKGQKGAFRRRIRRVNFEAITLGHK